MVKSKAAPVRPNLPGQVVLVLQGGGALGAYQVGVYQALHEAGIEPDWVIGTSIGAINGALIAGNPPAQRLARLQAFWQQVERRDDINLGATVPWLGGALSKAQAVAKGLPGFFVPNPAAWWGQYAALGVEQASYYDTAPLRETLEALVDFDCIRHQHTRLTVGAVNANSGEMRYFDSRNEVVNASHVMASGALPPAFPAVRVDSEPYWDGGIYSNTPIEAVLDDKPRRDSVIFSAQVWNPIGPEPKSIWEVQSRVKDIQFASRAKNHIERQKQLHRLRHIIRELQGKLPPALRERSDVKSLTTWGCGTTMHVVKLNAPRLDGDDQTKDIDFSTHGIETRRAAGYEETRRVLAEQPWRQAVDPMEGVLVHEAGDGHRH